MTVVDSPLPSDPDPPELLSPELRNPRSGVPLELAELCGWRVHEIEIAVSLIRADRADTNAEAMDELRTALWFVDRLLGVVDGSWFPDFRMPFSQRTKIADLVAREGLLQSGQMALFSIAIWRWDGQTFELQSLQRRLKERLAKLEDSERKVGAF